MRDASTTPFWLDRPRPAEAAPLGVAIEADLAIVGGGFTGLWAAVLAKRERPEREVVLLEAETAGWGASGRNGGFVDASLTHGLANGASRFAAELDALEAAGRANLAELKADLERHRIDAAWEEPGLLSVATQPHELTDLHEEVALLRRFGWDADVLDRDAARAEVASPTYLGAIRQRTRFTSEGNALVPRATRPARMVCPDVVRTTIPGPSLSRSATCVSSWMRTPSRSAASASPQANRAGSTRALSSRVHRPARYVGESTSARTASPSRYSPSPARPASCGHATWYGSVATDSDPVSW